jgi:uncharacterized membrane protein YgcG
MGTDHPLEGSAPRTTHGWRLLVSVAAVIVIVYGIQASQQVLVPLLLSVFLAVIGARPVAWMDRRGLPHTLSVAVFVLGVMSALIVVSAIVGTSLTEFSNRIPIYQESLSEALTDVAERIVGRRTPLSVEELLANVEPASAMRLTATVLTALRGVFANAFVILFTVVFILLEISSFPLKLNAIHPRSRATIQEFATFADSLQHYLNLKTLICLLTGLAVRPVGGRAGNRLPCPLGPARVSPELRADHRIVHRRNSRSNAGIHPVRPWPGAHRCCRLRGNQHRDRKHARAAGHGRSWEKGWGSPRSSSSSRFSSGGGSSDRSV